MKPFCRSIQKYNIYKASYNRIENNMYDAILKFSASIAKTFTVWVAAAATATAAAAAIAA